jgi:putative pyruvate formate lyase activating enzyme
MTSHNPPTANLQPSAPHLQPGYPSYLPLFRSGELARRAEALRALATPCRLCPRECHVDRRAGQMGYCHGGWQACVASHHVHNGEEPPISGERASGTVFFTHCTLRCLYCQNYRISQQGVGGEMTDEQLASAFLEVQDRNCHNLNLVTPTHYLHAIISALMLAAGRGFRLPIVYNTSGYERVETLRLLDGIVDIYLPDIKYGDPELAKRYSDAPDYVERNLEALREMQRQVGDLQCDDDGIARRGMIVRHLVLPGAEDQSIGVLETLRREVSPTATVSVMSQYFPAHRGLTTPPLDRKVDPEAYQRVADWVETTDLSGWIQPI